MKISSEIEKIAKANKIFIEILSFEQAQMIKNRILQKYSNKNKSTFLWESFLDFSIVNNKDGWTLIADYVNAKKCLMFFDDDDSIIVFKGGNDLYKLLSEMYGFEFYITNFTTENLICFNHHDCLMGCGTAKNWVNKLRNDLTTNKAINLGPDTSIVPYIRI